MAKKRDFGIGIVGCGMVADFHAQAINAIYRSALAGGRPVRLPLKRTPVRKPFR